MDDSDKGERRSVVLNNYRLIVRIIIYIKALLTLWRISVLKITSVVLLLVINQSVCAQIEVSTLKGDDSGGSLIAAIKNANAQKTDHDNPVIISFSKDIAGEIVLSMDLPPIENNISVIGNTENGKPVITINGTVNPEISGGLKGGISPGFSLFEVKSGNTASFENLHLTKSNKSGIIIEGGVVTVKNCMLTYNFGIGSVHGTAGAIQSENSQLTVIGTYFFYNTGGVGGTDGGVGYGGAGSVNIVGGNAVFINSSFFENEGGFGGVGVGSVGGAGVIMVRDGNVSIVNCTAAGNFGGGSIVTGASGGIVMLGGNMSLFESTIAGNMGGAGLGGFDGVDFCSGGIHVLAGKLSLGGNIIAGNYNGADEASDLEFQANGEVHSLGYNLFGSLKKEFCEEGDSKGFALKDIVATTSEGKYKNEIVSGFLPTIALTTNSPARSKNILFNDINPVSSYDANAIFFNDAARKYSSLLQADQNGKLRGDNPSIGAVE